MVSAHVPIHLLEMTTNTLWDMRKFSVWLAQTFEPLPHDYDLSVQTWLAKTTYTTKDKEGFIKELDEKGYLEKVDRACKCFVKAETYAEFKYPRPIKSRTDRFKAYMGPAFQGINEQLFSRTEYFIKKIPVNERASFLKECLGLAAEINCTDFSSFEAHFLDCIMYAIEFPLYFWLTKDLPIATDFREELMTLAKVNICKFIDFVVDCMSRASGEMNTSSGNGWVNLVLFLYVSLCKGSIKSLGKFEGDDGITTNDPTTSAPTSQDYQDLGWVCKLIKVTKFEEASFCGIVADIDDLVNVCDIKAYLGDFGWTRQQYLNANEVTIKALIRAKGYSAIYQYPGCPIIDALGHYALRVTDYDEVHRKMLKMYRKGHLADSRYKNQKFEVIFGTLINKRPSRIISPINTRLLVERIFQIPLNRQYEIERYLDDLNTIQPLEIDLDVPECWIYNWENFVIPEMDLESASHWKQLEQALVTIGV